MSVFILSQSEFASIVATLKRFSSLFPLSAEEKYERLEFYPDKTVSEFSLSRIEPFVYRLYIANAMAEQYTYMKDGQAALTVPLIDLPQGHSVSFHDLLETLGSLSYNLVTNGGNTFLGVKDQEKLDSLISAIQRELLR